MTVDLQTDSLVDENYLYCQAVSVLRVSHVDLETLLERLSKGLVFNRPPIGELGVKGCLDHLVGCVLSDLVIFCWHVVWERCRARKLLVRFWILQ